MSDLTIEDDVVPQQAPDLGVFVTYYWEMGTIIRSVHKNLSNAVAAASGYSREIGFIRYDSEDIEPIQPEGQLNDEVRQQ